MSRDLTSRNQATNPSAMIHQRARDTRRLHVWIAFLFTTLFLAFAPRADAQNVQYDDKALDLGSRSALRVDPVTRGLSFDIPLGSYTGRGGMNVPVTMSYTSKVWNVEFQGYNPGTNPPYNPTQAFTIVVAKYAKHSVAGWTSSIGMPVLDNTPNGHVYNQIGEPKPNNVCPNPCLVVDRKTIWMPDGSGHELRASDQPRLFTDPLPDNFYAADDSRMRYQASTGTLFLPDGSRYLLNSSQYIDRNGNKLTYSNGAWTDTLGRQIANPLPYNFGSSPTAGDQTLSLPGVGGMSVNYTLKWRNLADVLTTPQNLRYTADGGCPPGLSGPFSPYLFGSDWANRTCIANAGVFFNPVVLSQVVLPTGQAYTFTYNVYGEIDKVVMPTGGYEKYTYGTVSPISNTTYVYNQGNRGVLTRAISSNGLGNDEAVWTYSGESGNTTIVGPAPESKRTEISYWTDENTNWGWGINSARGGKIYDDRTYNSSGQMLRRKMTDWAMTGSNASGNWFGSDLATRHARPVREVEFVLDTGDSALAKSTTYTFDTTYQFTVGVEQSSVRVYDFVTVDQTTAQTITITSLSSIPNGTLLKRTATTYLTSDQNYRDRNFLGLPTSVSVYNGSDVLVSQTTLSYDEASYPLINVGSPPYTGWTDPSTSIRGNVTTTANWLNTSGTFLQIHAQYDQFGSVRKNWDANQNLTQTDYSSTFAFAYPTQITSADPDGGGPATALVSTTEYDFSTGRPTATVDANNQRTTFAYDDPLNRIRQVVRASTDTSAKTQTTYTYDDANRTLTVSTDQNSFNDNLIKNQTVFDGLGRVAEHRQYETVADYVNVKTEYDIQGRVYRRSNPYRSGETIAWTTSEFDLLDRATSVTTADGAVIRTAYAGNRLLNTDQAGKQRVNRVNAAGQLTDVWEITAADGATEAISFPSHPEVSAGYRTSYQYDALSNLVKVTQGSQQRYFLYDSLKRLIRVRALEQGINGALNLLDPVTGNSSWSIGYVYDANGNILQRIDPRGVTSTYTYDGLNRNLTIDYSDTVSINPDVKRFYDGAANGKGLSWYFYKGGDFSTGSNVEHTSIDSYDALGRPLVRRQLFKLNGVWSPTYQISSTYNRAGAVLSQTYPSGHTVTYTYDAAGRTSSLTGNLGDGSARTYSNSISYSPFGGLAREQFGTATPLYHKSFYNIRGQLFDTRLSSVDDTWDWNRGRLILYYSSNHLWGQSGTDNNGNLRYAETWIPPANAALDQADTLFEDAYSYDSLNRLTGVAGQRMSVATGWGNWQQQFRQQYTYDRFGNRTIDAAQTWGTGINNKQFSVDTATNRYGVPSGQTGTMSYDLAGNLITDTYTGAGTREYDAENKMTRAWGGNNQWQEYTYNADGQRTRRKIDGQETWQIYGMGSDVLAEYAANGSPSTPQKEYGYRNGQLLVVTSAGSGDQSLNLNSAGAYVQAANSSSLNISGAITVEAWIKVNAVTGSYQDIVTRESWNQAGTGGGFELSVTNSGKLRLDTYQSPTAYTPLVGGTTITTGVWHHVAGVFDGSQMRLYLDGVLETTLATGNGPASGTSSLKIGKASYGSNFSGLIDEVRLSNSALYTSNFTPQAHLTASSSTKGLWKFDGQSTADSSGNGNNGTLQSGATYSNDVPGGGGGSSQVQWLMLDHLGTPRMVVDQTGSLTSLKRHDYLPFGEELFAGRTSALGYTTGDGVRQHFTQKERDVETSLDYSIARYYSSTQGRFTGPDPLLSSGKPIHPQSWNRYAYCLNHPLLLVDPDGLVWGYYVDSNGQGHYHWYPDVDALKAAGATVVTNFVYKSSNGYYITLNPNANEYVQNIAEFDAHRAYWGFTGLAASWQDWIPVWGQFRHFMFNYATGNYEGAIVNFSMASIDGGTMAAGFVSGVGRQGATEVAEQGILKLGQAEGAGRLVTQPNRIYSARVLLRSAEETGPYHNFPMSFDEHIMSQGSRTFKSNFFNQSKQALSNDSIMYRLSGSVNGRSGVFEIGVRPSVSGRTEVIMHRFFKPN